MKPKLTSLTGFSFYCAEELPTQLRTTFALPADPLGNYQEWGREQVQASIEQLKRMQVYLFQASNSATRWRADHEFSDEDIVECYYYHGQAIVYPQRAIYQIAQYNSPANAQEERDLASRISKIGDAAIWHAFGRRVTVTGLVSTGPTLL